MLRGLPKFVIPVCGYFHFLENQTFCVVLLYCPAAKLATRHYNRLYFVTGRVSNIKHVNATSFT